MIRVCSLQIIGRNHSHTFTLQVFVHSFMSILMIWKQIDGYIYKVVSGKISFAATCSEKE